MNQKIYILVFIGIFVFGISPVFGNPGMLPNHPGYPMGDAKDPVTGQSVANDPGQSPPSQKESLQQAGEFHDAHAMHPGKEDRPNIVPPGESKDMDTKSKSTQ